MSGPTVPEWLAQRALTLPDRPALIGGGRQWTFGQLHGAADALVGWLAGLGVEPGDRVATLLRNGPHTVQVIHALTRLGAVLTPLNTRLSAPELAWPIQDATVRLLLHDEATAALASALRAQAPGVRLEVLTAQPPGAPAPSIEPGQLDLDSPHSIIYTSGTTGRPKGVTLTYANHWWSAVGSALNLGTHEADRWLAVLPLFHVGGQAIVLRGVIYGVPVVVHEGFDPTAVNTAIDQDGVTIVSVVAAMLRRMLDDRAGRPYPPTLRCVLLGGGPAPLPLLHECAQLGLPVVQTYGLTETASQVVTLAPADALRKLGSAGKPLLPVDLRVEHEGRPAAPGQAGEIVLRGPNVMAGYLNQPEATAHALRGGWLHTGDLGYLDDQGYLYVLDRRDDLIISGGENVYPAEVEAALLAHPAVAEAIVVGLPHPRWGQAPAAAVTLRPGQSIAAAALIAHCAARLARYKVPTVVRFRQALPRNAAGKPLRRIIREGWPDPQHDETAGQGPNSQDAGVHEDGTATHDGETVPLAQEALDRRDREDGPATQHGETRG